MSKTVILVTKTVPVHSVTPSFLVVTRDQPEKHFDTDSFEHAVDQLRTKHVNVPKPNPHKAHGQDINIDEDDEPEGLFSQ